MAQSTKTRDNSAGERQGATVFVRNLSYQTSSEHLTNTFSDVAPVRHATVVQKPGTNESKGYGFVTFALSSDAERAVEQLKGTKLDGRVIKLDYAKRRHRETKAEEDDAQPTQTSNPLSGKGRKKEPEKRKDVSTRLIIRNMPWSFRDSGELRKKFTRFGKVVDCVIPRGKGGKMTGFAFVQLKDQEAAERAIQGFNGYELDGRTVSVDFAVPQPEWQESHDLNQDGSDISDETNNEDESNEGDSADDASDVDKEIPMAPSDDEIVSDEGDSASGSEESMSQDEEAEEDEEDEAESEAEHSSNEGHTVFVRNVSYDTEQDDLYDFFRQFGPLKYAVLVTDPSTGRPRGTAFVSFHHYNDMIECIRTSARNENDELRQRHSVLKDDTRQDEQDRMVLDGRGLIVTPAVDRKQAQDLKEKGEQKRKQEMGKGLDKRRMYLLQEGKMEPSQLSESDQRLRQASYDQRRKLLQSNPSLHLSLTRLSVRNLPRRVGDTRLKHLARVACVGFAQDVKAKKRHPITKEELSRQPQNQETKRKGGIVTQAKIVYDKDGAGRSRGYGFIEFVSHKYALMALRWLNGRPLTGQDSDYDGITLYTEKKKNPEKEPREQEGADGPREGKKRAIVEFAIENASVVKRRAERIQQSRESNEQKKRKRQQEEQEAKEAKRKKAEMDPEQARNQRIILHKRVERRNKRKS